MKRRATVLEASLSFFCYHHVDVRESGLQVSCLFFLCSSSHIDISKDVIMNRSLILMNRFGLAILRPVLDY